MVGKHLARIRGGRSYCLKSESREQRGRLVRLPRLRSDPSDALPPVRFLLLKVPKRSKLTSQGTHTETHKHTVFNTQHYLSYGPMGNLQCSTRGDIE